MLTVCAALAVWGGCAAARRYLDRTSRRETEFWGGRVRLTALWNPGAAFGLPIPERCLSAASGAAAGTGGALVGPEAVPHRGGPGAGGRSQQPPGAASPGPGL